MYETPATYGTPMPAGPPPISSPPVISGVPVMAPPAQGSSVPTASPSPAGALPATAHPYAPPYQSPAPEDSRQPRRGEARAKGKPRRDDCAELREECVRLREQADATLTAAAAANAEADEVHAAYVEAQRATEEATRAHEAAIARTATITAELNKFERDPTEAQQRLERETTHAAFAAYRRGDISSEQLREVFRRAEGWTPEQDQLSRDALQARADEGEALRLREAAVQAEQVAAERARIANVSARALDEEARTAVEDARGVCAAAADCGQRGRRR
jgi:hypothetical protein